MINEQIVSALVNRAREIVRNTPVLTNNLICQIVYEDARVIVQFMNLPINVLNIIEAEAQILSN